MFSSLLRPQYKTYGGNAVSLFSGSGIGSGWAFGFFVARKRIQVHKEDLMQPRPGTTYMSTRTTSVISRVALAAWLAAVSGGASLQAADVPVASKSSDPYEALSFYQGTWTLLDKKHEGYTETCSWLAGGGRRHIVCRSSVTTAGENRESLGVYSYDEAKSEFVYHGFSKPGSVYIERGKRIANGFVYTSEQGAGADRVRTRFTIVEGEHGRVSTVNEKSTADGPWVVDEKLEYLRTRP